MDSHVDSYKEDFDIDKRIIRRAAESQNPEDKTLMWFCRPHVDGIKCRIDAVDFAADEVWLTNIEDKNRPIRFSESIQYVRSYVEDAGTAIYDIIPKKSAARESVRDKLKSAQKAQPLHTPKPQKSKGKDMVL